MVLKTMLVIVWGFAVLMLLYVAFALCKNENTFRNRAKIIKAIYRFEVDMTSKGDYESLRKVDCLHMENYDETNKRFWDWGYTRILPKEQYELIEPYIKKGK